MTDATELPEPEPAVDTSSLQQPEPGTEPDVESTEEVPLGSIPASQLYAELPEDDKELLQDRADNSVASAAAQRAADEEFRRNHPDTPLVRAANPAVGGEFN